jgi:phosphoglycerate dehydrogenase-like enzyme
MAAKKLRLHIENSRQKAGVYHITPERWEKACARHKALARRLDVSFGWDGDVLEQALATAQIAMGVPARREHFAQRAPRLEWMHATLAGVDRYLPLDWLPSRVAFTNNRGAHGLKAEQYMRMAYTLLNTRLPEIIANQQAHKWERLFSPSLAGKTALVIGLGDLGEAAARAARQVGLKVVGVRRSAKKSRHADSVHPFTKLDRLLPAADFVVVAVPLTDETRNLLSRERLALMKPSAGVINIARAAVIDYEALCESLRNGRLAGAVLDVADPEPLPPESPLWNTPRLILTPHISCDDSENYVEISLDLWFANLARFVAGKPLKSRVDRRLGY